MDNLLEFILNKQLKQKQSKNFTKNQGFTLIELLVAMILAVLVLTPLLGFMINLLDNERREQAKSNSEQEVQLALDYISQDLQQAIYIYDAKGINSIKDQLPNKTDRTPVLVFWTRQYKEDVIVAASKYSRKTNDAFVYSLVAYYLIKSDSTNNKDKIWSNEFRIARFELNGGVTDPDNPKDKDGNLIYIKDKNGVELKPDSGFKMFNLDGSSTLENKMNTWKKDKDKNYTKNAEILIDYVDNSQKVDADTSFKPIGCHPEVFDIDKDINIPTGQKTEKKAALTVPAVDGTSEFGNGSFYACVDTNKVSAKVFIRGNALARINNKDAENNFSKDIAAYFPSVGVQVRGKGLIGGEQK
jgi:prepilin-type N-terminal cleavage/methylation domain-containing protein